MWLSGTPTCLSLLSAHGNYATSAPPASVIYSTFVLCLWSNSWSPWWLAMRKALAMVSSFLMGKMKWGFRLLWGTSRDIGNFLEPSVPAESMSLVTHVTPYTGKALLSKLPQRSSINYITLQTSIVGAVQEAMGTQTLRAAIRNSNVCMPRQRKIMRNSTMNGKSGVIYTCYDDCSRAPTLHLDI